MQVQDLQCQIAQAQIARYLKGDRFDPEALKQLNDHIDACDRCKSAIAERRAELQEKIVQPAQPSVTTTAPSNDSKTTRTGPPRIKAKPLVYACALALVLGAMSYLAQDPTSLFGEKASINSLPATNQVGEKSIVTTSKPIRTSAPPATTEEKPVKIAVNNVAPGKDKTPAALNGPLGNINSAGQPAVTAYPPNSAIAKAVSTKASITTALHTTKPAKPLARWSRKTSSQITPRHKPRIVVYDPEGKVVYPETDK